VFIKNLSGTFPASLSAYTTQQINEAFTNMILELVKIKAAE
jgi:hypothetical protein